MAKGGRDTSRYNVKAGVKNRATTTKTASGKTKGQFNPSGPTGSDIHTTSGKPDN